MPLQAPRGMKMGTFLAFLNSRSFRVEWDLTGLVLRSCRIGATSSCRNWTRIPLVVLGRSMHTTGPMVS
jgi:hypothetical protein